MPEIRSSSSETYNYSDSTDLQVVNTYSYHGPEESYKTSVRYIFDGMYYSLTTTTGDSAGSGTGRIFFDVTSFGVDFLDNIASVHLIGYNYNDVLRGGAGNDILEGGAGADTINGSAGNNTASYENAADRVVVSLDHSFISSFVGDAAGDEFANVQNLRGSAFDDTLSGDSGGNTLEGGENSDKIFGQDGIDIASYVHSASAVTVNLATDVNTGGDAQGDQIAEIENILGSAFADRLTGDGGINVIDGGAAGADRLSGGAADDTYIVSHAGVSVIEAANAGADTVKAAINYTLSANVEDLTLTGTSNINGVGNGLANTLTGNSNNNALNGNAGADNMRGGFGYDTYCVDNVGDQVIELVGQGGDAVRAAISYTLVDNVETLVLTSASNIAGTGNGLANAITRGSGANQLAGLGGRDTLTGGAGLDTFVFKALSDSTVASTGRDTITDFRQADHDRIDLRLLDANTGLNGDQAFTLIGMAAFSHKAGELHYETSGENTLVSGDVNGDGAGDFAILLQGQITLARGDLLL